MTGHNTLCQFYDPLGLRDWLSTIGFLNGTKQVMFGLQSTLFHKIYDIEMLIYGKKTENGIFTRISETFSVNKRIHSANNENISLVFCFCCL